MSSVEVQNTIPDSGLPVKIYSQATILSFNYYSVKKTDTVLIICNGLTTSQTELYSENDSRVTSSILPNATNIIYEAPSNVGFQYKRRVLIDVIFF